DISRMCEDREWHGHPLLWLALTNGLLGVALIVYPFIDSRYVTPLQALPIAGAAGIGLLGMPAAAWYFTSHGRKSFRSAYGSLILYAIIAIFGLRGAYDIVAPTRTTKYVSEVIMREMKPGDTIVSFDEVLQGIPFYTKQRVMITGDPGELDYGSKQSEGEGWFPTREEFLKEWRAGDKRFILVSEGQERLNDLFPDGDTGAAKKIECGKYIILFNVEEPNR
ncbi:MAG: hypothetical protein HUJ86_04070, partial [Synergistes sp.]|nr:hypothetical protein [Synergistes sp.]